jgi:NAD(P)-dependent dehydrogenase (short-subunit alcohol dehydrogenase family)
VFSIDNRVVLITGAGTGTMGAELGAGCAEILAGQGAAVLVNDVRAERAEETVSKIKASGGRAAAVPFDITDFGAVRSAVGAAESVFGPPDILINNVGAPDVRQNRLFSDVDLTQPSETSLMAARRRRRRARVARWPRCTPLLAAGGSHAGYCKLWSYVLACPGAGDRACAPGQPRNARGMAFRGAWVRSRRVWCG